MEVSGVAVGGNLEAYLCEKSGSRLAVEMGDSSRYWMLFLRLLGMFRQIKTPVVAGAPCNTFEDLSTTDRFPQRLPI
jgi:hypothetical protein